MKLINLLDQGTVSGFEIVPNVMVLSVFVEDKPYALDVDTSSLQSGTQLVRINDYSVAGGVLTVGGLTLGVDTEVSGFRE